MQLSRDVYGRLKYSQLHLANPQKQYIDILNGIKELKLKLYANSLSELSFKIYEYEDGIRNELYDLIEEKRLIEVQYVGWFQIQEPKETHDENSTALYKMVTAYTLENELIGKFVYALDGVYSLYDITDEEHSLLHIVMKYCSWSVGHIDNELLLKYRTFSIDSERIYNLLTGKIAESFGCVVQFNTYDKTINCYAIENFGKLTNITISKQNVLQQFEKTSDADSIITKMRIRGGTSTSGNIFDIRAVNLDGSDSLINLDYYRVPYDPVTKTGWMTQGLCDALDNYQSACDTYLTQYSTKLDLLKQCESELTVLNAELESLQNQYKAAQLVCGTYRSQLGRVPIISDSVYNLYQTALTNENNALINKLVKQSQVTSKQDQITSVKTVLNNINSIVDINNYFTTTQLVELDSFITQGDDFSDDSYVETDTMTSEEVLDLKLELKSVGERKLAEVSRPQYTYQTTLSNFLSIIDNDFEDWYEQFDIANLITLMFRDNYSPTVRLMIIEFDFDNLNDLNLTFSDKNRLDDKLVQLAEVIAQSNRTNNSFSLSKFGYDAASKQTSSVREFMTNSLNATTNRVISDINIQNEFSQFGLLNRKWLEDQNKYDDHQSLLTQNILLFTDDAWNSGRTGIGFFTNDVTNETFYGVMGDVIVGKILLGEQLTISNTSGTYTINDNGFTATSGIYSVGINPSTASEIFNIKVNGSNKFYVDTINNRLVMNGEIQSTVGNIGGWSIGSNGLTSPTSRMKLSGSGMNLFNSYGIYLGGIASTTSTDGGVVLVKSDAADYLAIATTSDSNPDDGMNVSLNILYTPNDITRGDIYYESGFHFRLTNVYLDYGELKVDGDITSGSYLKANIQVEAPSCKFTTGTFTNGYFTNLYVGIDNVLTTGNYTSYVYSKSQSDSKYSLTGHSHSDYATKSELSALASRVSALENA